MMSSGGTSTYCEGLWSRTAKPVRPASLSGVVGSGRGLRGVLADVAKVLCLLILLMAVAGCQSDAARAYRGAQLYAAGTRALEAGEHAQAVAALSRAADLVPHASEIQNHLGLAYLGHDQPERAREAFLRAVELDCDNTAAAANLARLTGSE